MNAFCHRSAGVGPRAIAAEPRPLLRALDRRGGGCCGRIRLLCSGGAACKYRCNGSRCATIMHNAAMQPSMQQPCMLHDPTIGCVMQQSHGIAGGVAAALAAEHAITSQHLLHRTVRLVETTGSCRARSRPTPSSLGATRCSLTALRCAIAGD